MKNKLQRAAACLLFCACLTAALTLPAGAASVRFSDVPASCWAASEIARAADTGLFQGETAKTFGLGHSMTRAAFVTVLGRLFAWQAVMPSQGTFADNRNPSAWYYSAVETAAAEGAVTRQSDKFRPNDPVTREEMAVMLVRALGYGSIAGLSQGLEAPFTDVTSNPGYLSMAYRLGIAGGTSDTTFSPNVPATREQAAVMLMRVYDRIHSAAPFRLGIVNGPGGATDLSGLDAVAVAAVKLAYNGQINCGKILTDTYAAAVRNQARNAGALALLSVTGSNAVFSATAADTAAAIANETEVGGWDGVLLDLPELTEAQRQSYSALVTELKAALGGRLLYVTAEVPTEQGTVYGGYDYAVLGQQADRLILRVAAYDGLTDDDFPVAPLEPLGEVYCALCSALQEVDASKLSLWLTTTGSAWTGTQKPGSVTAEEIEELLSSPDTTAYHSDRYAAAYLVRTVKDSRAVVWYNDGPGTALRVRLAAFLGVHSVCLSDLSSVADYPDYSLLSGLQ